MKNWIVGLYLFVFNVAAYAQVLSGPFTPTTGGGLMSGSFSFQNYDFIARNDLDSGQTGKLLRSVYDYTIKASVEYGATDRLVIFAALPIKIVGSSSTLNTDADFTDTLKNGSLTGIGNVELGAKFRFPIKENKFQLTVGLKGELNTSGYDDPTGLRTGFDAWGIAPTVWFGHQSENKKFYFWVHAGGAYRIGNWSSEWNTGGEVGYKLWEAIWVRFNVDSRQSFENSDFQRPRNLQTGLYLNNQQYVALTGKLGYEHKKGIGAQFSISGLVGAHNIGDAPIYNIGLYYRWNYADQTP